MDGITKVLSFVTLLMMIALGWLVHDKYSNDDKEKDIIHVTNACNTKINDLNLKLANLQNKFTNYKKREGKNLSILGGGAHQVKLAQKIVKLEDDLKLCQDNLPEDVLIKLLRPEQKEETSWWPF